MKKQTPKLYTALAMLVLTTFNLQPSTAFAQGTAFMYQGRLNVNASPGSGSYDLQFTLYATNVNGTAIAGPVTNNDIAVSNGLFTVTIDFGSGVFNGANYWLDVAVRTNGIGNFTELTPRQQFRPTPYSIFAEGANAAGLSGTVPAGTISGTYDNPVILDNSGNSFTGNGGGLSGVNAAALGGLSAPDFWQAAGNAGTIAGANFIGTTDNQPLEMRVDGGRALRLEPGYTNGAPNVIGGSPANFASGGIVGATIAGGGATNWFGPGYTNRVLADFGAIGGGLDNSVINNYATVAGGIGNSAGGGSAVVGGGAYNYAGANYSGIVGGFGNIASGAGAFIGGGGFDGTTYTANQAIGNASIIGGGLNNSATNTYSTIGGGSDNIAGGTNSTVAGGTGNIASLDNSVVGGGWGNAASAVDAAIGGGDNNVASSAAATICGGEYNTADGDHTVVAGGQSNTASGSYGVVGGGNGNNTVGADDVLAGGYGNSSGGGNNSVISGGNNNNSSGSVGVIGGGQANQVSAFFATICGGVNNMATNNSSLVCGGTNNVSGGYASTVAGGSDNQAVGDYSLAAGNFAEATNNNSFVWSDGSANTASTATKQFVARASGGFILFSSGSGTGVSLPPGSGSWSTMSDRNAKDDFASLDPKFILAEVLSLPMTTWSYKTEQGVRHIGPMAQDFYSAFNVGEDNRHIADVDEGGVALAAIQGLSEKVESGKQKTESKIEGLEAENKELRSQVTDLLSQLDSLQKTVTKLAARYNEGIAVNSQSEDEK